MTVQSIWLLLCILDIYFLPSFEFLSLISLLNISYTVTNINNFAKQIKKTKVKIFQSFNNINYYSEQILINNKELKESNLFAHFDTRIITTQFQSIKPVIVDDSFDGIHKDVPFKIQEIYLSKIMLTGFSVNNDPIYFYPLYHPISVFEGINICFKFNKPILAKSMFATKQDYFTFNNIILPYCKMLLIYTILFLLIWVCIQTHHRIFVTLSFLIGIPVIYSFCCFFPFAIINLIKDFKIYFKNKKAEKYNKVKLESLDWEKKFYAYSENQVEARYILTPAFMQKFLNLTTAFGSKKAKCSFFKDKILIAISTNKNLFEFGDLLHPIDGNEFYEELASILDLIEYFKLNEHTQL